ncbi:hypothetical protein L3V83_13785 [Thiotrichales bacterium 19X7-9]|nr:hypothetical protein [Thiotrichales bacterium 19X7-9]
MKIYRLIPETENYDNRRWDVVSIYKGEIIVRAINENNARQIANISFSKAAKKCHNNGGCHHGIWSGQNFVRAEEIENSSYSLQGEEAILVPQGYNINL